MFSVYRVRKRQSLHVTVRRLGSGRGSHPLDSDTPLHRAQDVSVPRAQWLLSEETKSEPLRNIYPTPPLLGHH